jgi:flavorubredoxin
LNRNEIREGIYCVGVVDWNVRSFHGYTTDKGATYNAYLIIDEKIALIDTVKAHFADELLENIRQYVDPGKIDYIISNHVEMDHSGSLPAVAAACPNATIVTSDPQGMKGLSLHYGDLPLKSVKSGETLSLGKRTLTFVQTPMIHWPDNMITYCGEEKILFSNDSFGQHYSSSTRFDDESPEYEIFLEAKKYYANIVMPFDLPVKKALETVEALDIDIIAPSHGVVWRSHIAEIMDCYARWSANETEPMALIVYDSMWGSTEMLARSLLRGVSKKGLPAKLLDLKVNHISDIMTDLLTAKYILVGSPTLNNNMLPTVSAFLTYMKGLAPKGRCGLAFGSYGWSGQSVGQVEDALRDCKVDIIAEKIRVPYIPSKDVLREIEKIDWL